MTIIWKGSPNFDINRKPIRRIVIHWIVGNLAAADAVFAKKIPGTSAHYGIEDGTIHQYVDEKHVAYHAGVYSVNQESIGIEHSAAPDRPASEQTYQTSGKLIAEIAKRHNIPLDRQHIIGHKEVKATQCPGTIDIDKLIKIAKGGDDDMDAGAERDRNWRFTDRLTSAAGITLKGDNPEASVKEAEEKIKRVFAEAEQNGKDRDKWYTELQAAKKEIENLKKNPVNSEDQVLLSDLKRIIKKLAQ